MIIASWLLSMGGLYISINENSLIGIILNGTALFMASVTMSVYTAINIKKK